MITAQPGYRVNYTIDGIPMVRDILAWNDDGMPLVIADEEHVSTIGLIEAGIIGPFSLTHPKPQPVALASAAPGWRMRYRIGPDEQWESTPIAAWLLDATGSVHPMVEDAHVLSPFGELWDVEDPKFVCSIVADVQ